MLISADDWKAWDDYLHWQTADRAVPKRINRLIAEACRSPQAGLGKPEPLKYGLVGAWSRRITHEHRLVYRVVGDDLQTLQVRYHHT
ncbi:Txe/YoeB family addiction module toxin [Mycobacterium paraintracellulare]|uniref:Endoribonuclease YoeB n=1 Tax=Mycobacterium paraintracellulare TaxID=1138383 RepID=A0ABN6ATJ7_9MYCO|nr:Txe/YoeB family addiction module toxin [Mycobacterium paraintracellulare]AFC53030.1 toxin-antitoxin system, toxin component, Txe/YoeB family protein [Mycobacterium paraintracellulare]OSC29118.1 Txe/YoeB family addiction module toxin [Mycobacterium paraintracellulare]BBY71202.1 toxin YoeB [Mycobacterium paraintracellulare]